MDFFKKLLLIAGVITNSQQVDIPQYQNQCFQCVTQNIPFSYFTPKGSGFTRNARYSFIAQTQDPYFCTFDKKCRSADDKRNYYSCEQGISTCLQFNSDDLGSYVFDESFGLVNLKDLNQQVKNIYDQYYGWTEPTTEQIQSIKTSLINVINQTVSNSERIIEFVIQAPNLKKISITNFQLNQSIYLTPLIYRIEEQPVILRDKLGNKIFTIQTTYVPISVLSKEVFLARYNPQFREKTNETYSETGMNKSRVATEFLLRQALRVEGVMNVRDITNDWWKEYYLLKTYQQKTIAFEPMFYGLPIPTEIRNTTQERGPIMNDSMKGYELELESIFRDQFNSSIIYKRLGQSANNPSILGRQSIPPGTTLNLMAGVLDVTNQFKIQYSDDLQSQRQIPSTQTLNKTKYVNSTEQKYLVKLIIGNQNTEQYGQQRLIEMDNIEQIIQNGTLPASNNLSSFTQDGVQAIVHLFTDIINRFFW